MDMMILGETLQLNSGTTHFGFWMPAGGNDGVASVEVFLLKTANLLTVTMESKPSNTNDGAANAIGSVVLSSTTPQVYKFDVAGANDLVRYTITASGSAYVHLQFAQPLWQPN